MTATMHAAPSAALLTLRRGKSAACTWLRWVAAERLRSVAMSTLESKHGSHALAAVPHEDHVLRRSDFGLGGVRRMRVRVYVLPMLLFFCVWDGCHGAHNVDRCTQWLPDRCTQWLPKLGAHSGCHEWMP